MLRLHTAFFVPLAVLSAGTYGYADTILFANLTNSQENPPVVVIARPQSFGFAEFNLNAAQTAMTFTATIHNIDFTGAQTPGDISDDLTAAHIHRAPPGTNGPVIWGFIGTPFNDINPTDVVVTPFATGVGGTVSSTWDAPEGNGTATLTNQLPFILTQGTYMNFHTRQFPGGEIRGVLTVVPEPSAVVLLGFAVTATIVGFRRRDPRA